MRFVTLGSWRDEWSVTGIQVRACGTVARLIRFAGFTISIGSFS